MKSSKKKIYNRLEFTLIISFVAVFLLIIQLGKIQIFRNHELKTGALNQWTKSITVSPKRGNIYDRMGKKLAISVNSFTVWASPTDIKKVDKVEETAKTLAEVLDLKEDEVYEKIKNSEKNQKIKQWISRDEATMLKDMNLRGVILIEDNKRYYPNENFASYVLGFTDIDNKGLDGIEYIYNDYLTGIPGKVIQMTDGKNKQLPYGGEKNYEPEDGSSLVLTIDENIQHYAEKAADQAMIDTKAKSVSVIMMEVDTGEVLAMVNKPDFNPNEPREPMDEKTKKEWNKLSSEDLTKQWFELWRNPTISNLYEPGSTFKLITAAAALEENTGNLDTHYYCNGIVNDIKGATPIKCSRWYDPHEDQTFRQAMNNSCNVAFVQMGRQLGKDNMYKYIKAFGFGEKTEVDLLGEQSGIIPKGVDNIKEINLATLSYGHNIAVTPLQMVTAVSAVANGGNLLKPRILKEVLNSQGDKIESFQPEVIRKVISKETSNTMLSLMETVVSDGSGSRAYMPGYKIGGKTGTAKKAIDGVYKEGKYIGSFIAVAPIDDPKVVILVIVDEPSGTVYGGSVAAPVVKSILEDTFNYYEISPKFDNNEKNEITLEVPDVRKMKIGDAGKALNEIGLKHNAEYLELTNESVILDQFPLPGAKVKKGTIIDLYIDYKPSEEAIVPILEGKNKEEVVKILNAMNLKYEIKGNGKVISQSPLSGQKVKLGSTIKIEFK